MTKGKQIAINKLALIGKSLAENRSLLDRAIRLMSKSSEAEYGVVDKEWSYALKMLRFDIVNAEWEAKRIIDEMNNTLTPPRVKGL